VVTVDVPAVSTADGVQCCMCTNLDGWVVLELQSTRSGGGGGGGGAHAPPPDLLTAACTLPLPLRHVATHAVPCRIAFSRRRRQLTVRVSLVLDAPQASEAIRSPSAAESTAMATAAAMLAHYALPSASLLDCAAYPSVAALGAACSQLLCDAYYVVRVSLRLCVAFRRLSNPLPSPFSS
jgi:hypothetical protein